MNVAVTAVEPLLLHVNHRGDWLIVRVRTTGGLVGLGEASQSGDDCAAMTYLEHLGRALHGREIESVPSLMADLRPLARNRAAAVALSGIEQALWDLAGQAAGVPMAALLGGSERAEVFVYANVNRETVDRSPAGFAASVSRAVAAGFRAVKCNPFDGVDVATCRQPGSWATVSEGIERVQAVRAALGPETELMVDCQSRFDGLLALEVARALQPLRLAWLEDPVPADDLDGLRLLRARAEVPLATGESLRGAHRFWPLLREQLVDYVLPDVKHCGGVREMVTISHAAAAAGIRVAPHNPSGPIGTVVSAHVLATLPTPAWLEVATGEVPWRTALLQPGERVSAHGTLPLPSAPGLGVTLNDALAETHRV